MTTQSMELSRGWLLALIVAIIGVHPALGQSRSGYSISDLGSLGGNFVLPLAINNQGIVAGGGVRSDGTEFAMMWQSSTGPVDLGPLPGDAVSSCGRINNQGIVLATSRLAQGSSTDAPPRAFIWQTGGGKTDIGAGTGWSTQPYAINDSNQVVGSASTDNFTSSSFGFLWSPSVGMSAVTIPGTIVQAVTQINNSGQMLVESPNSASVLFYQPGHDPITIRNDQAIGYESFGLNNNGVVVGKCYYPNNDIHAFIWNQQEGLVDLTPGEGIESWGLGVNDQGQAIGAEWLDHRTTEYGFLYDQGQVYALSSLLDGSGTGWSSLFPEAINNSGQIVGWGVMDGQGQGFIMNPTDTSATPEPATVGILALGCVGLLWRRKGKQHTLYS